MLALAILLVVCLWWHGRQIPANITRRATQALASAGFDSGYVQTVDGRVVVLSGEMLDAVIRQRLVEAVASLVGVRRVIDNLSIVGAESPWSDEAKVDDRAQVAVSQQPARFQLRVSDNTVMIKGSCWCPAVSTPAVWFHNLMVNPGRGRNTTTEGRARNRRMALTVIE